MGETWTGVRIGPAQLKVLAHPLRARLLAALRVEGPATATRLAERLATNTGATSYHLRQLAEVGLVAEESRAGRQRFWRAVHDRHSIEAADFAGDPDSQAALEWLETFYRGERERWAAQWHAEQEQWPAEWREAVTNSDYLLHLSPARLRELNREVDDLMQRYAAMPPEEGSERVITYFENFLWPTRKER